MRSRASAPEAGGEDASGRPPNTTGRGDIEAPSHVLIAPVAMSAMGTPHSQSWAAAGQGSHEVCVL